MTTTAEEKNTTCNNCHGHEDGCQYCNYTGHRKWTYTKEVQGAFIIRPDGGELCHVVRLESAIEICDKFNELEKLREAEVSDHVLDQEYYADLKSSGDPMYAAGSRQGKKQMRSKLSPKIAQLQAENTKLMDILKSCKREHRICEDSFYSCPKAEDGCSDERQGNECNCGAEDFNNTIASIITEKALASLPEEKGVLTYKDFPNSVYDLPYNKKVELWMNQENDIVIGEKVHHNERGDVIFLTPERNPEYSYPLSWFDGWREIK